MILFEFEGKNLLKTSGISVPNSQLIKSLSGKVLLKPPFFAKAQVLSGKRKAVGGIVEVTKQKDIKPNISKMLKMTVNGEKVTTLLLEEKIEFESEFYISVSYDTNYRSPVVTYSEKGGTGVEERKSHIFPVDILTSKVDYKKVKIKNELKDFIDKLIALFLKEDAILVEINPVVITKRGEIIALDAKIKLDDDALGKHQDRNFKPRGVAGHKPTKNEIAAKNIDKGDYRGTAGSTYFDLPGDIGILASGGGASLTGMDMLIGMGGKPANYTEYSSDPSREKVKKLAKIVLSKPNLHGLWVGGAVANFTDIYETLSGVLDAVRQSKVDSDFPIVIRRGGPRDSEAFEMLKRQKGYNFCVYGPETSITESTKIMAKLARDYATSS